MYARVVPQRQTKQNSAARTPVTSPLMISRGLLAKPEIGLAGQSLFWPHPVRPLERPKRTRGAGINKKAAARPRADLVGVALQCTQQYPRRILERGQYIID